MKVLKAIISLSLITVVITSISASAQQGSERRSSSEAWDQITMQGRVEAIDWQKREVLLRGENGDLVTMEANETVKRFNEIGLGDLIKAEFWTYMKAEFRNPTPEELQEPLVILAAAEKSPKDLPPGAAVVALVKAG